MKAMLVCVHSLLLNQVAEHWKEFCEVWELSATYLLAMEIRW